jgi:hypothetical protein
MSLVGDTIILFAAGVYQVTYTIYTATGGTIGIELSGGIITGGTVSSANEFNAQAIILTNAINQQLRLVNAGGADIALSTPSSNVIVNVLRLN